MIVLDVNLLVAAARSDHSHHALVTDWMSRVLESGESFTAPDSVWIGVIRILTHPSVFEVPSALRDALRFQQQFMAQDWYQTYPALPHGWAVFAKTAADGQARGNLIPDAYIAAFARSLGVPVATEDRGFRRYDDVLVIHPA